MNSFEQIYILDLHGSAKKREQAPDNSKDENVFDIQQGVAITVLIKKPGLKRGIFHGDLWGRRISKYRSLTGLTFEKARWTQLMPASPSYLLIPHDKSRWRAYSNFHSINEILTLNGVGVVTARDHLAIHFDITSLKNTIREFISLGVEEARSRFDLRDDVQNWRVEWAQKDIVEHGQNPNLFVPIYYRPFDVRYTYYSGVSNGFLCRPGRNVMQHMVAGANIGVSVTRQVKTGNKWSHVLASNVITESTNISSRTSEIGYLFPLYLCPSAPGTNTKAVNRYTTTSNAKTGGSIENISAEFRSFLDDRYTHHYSPEEILGYIYAALHAPTYRARYAEFLRIEFPRVPFPEASEDFERLSLLGWALVRAHLLREVPRRNLAAYHGKGDHEVEFVRYSPEEQSIAINKTQSFKPVPPAVWDFHIGGYQVLDKYLKSRKSRTLSLDEINHTSAVADALAFTFDQMAKIDEAYLAAFPGRG